MFFLCVDALQFLLFIAITIGPLALFAFGIALTAHAIDPWLGVAASLALFLIPRRIVRDFIGQQAKQLDHLYHVSLRAMACLRAMALSIAYLGMARIRLRLTHNGIEESLAIPSWLEPLGVDAPMVHRIEISVKNGRR